MYRNRVRRSPAGVLDRTTDELPSLPCRRPGPDLWFAETAPDLAQAKRLCAPCPARTDCLAGALLRAEPWGVWGGEIVEDGVVVARKRSPGRPRKVRPEPDVAPAA
jgi:WhiB family redox-sensing transcriptional regulator